MIPLFTTWTSAHPLPTIATASALALAFGVVVARRRKTASPGGRRKFSAGTLAAAFAFIICTSVSLNTSYRFTHDGLGMTGSGERVLSCAAFESLIAMCVLGARERLAAEDTPGWFGSAVWIFAGLSSVPAWHEGGGLTTDTVVRVIVGSFGAALSAHSALGLELRHRSGGESQAPMAVIARDLRERLMALMGLSHRNRTALEITRERALDRAVDLADKHHRLTEEQRKKRFAGRLAKRLAKAQDRAGIASDEAQKDLYRARVIQRRFATKLVITENESPWHEGTGTDERTEQVLTDLEARIKHMEGLAEETEAAVAAQLGTPANPPAAAPGEAAAPRVPKQPEGESLDRSAIRDLKSYPTKRAALEALYGVRIAEDDNRSNNAIAEALIKELAAAGIKLDRGAANRYVSELRTVNATSEDDEETETVDRRELVSA